MTLTFASLLRRRSPLLLNFGMGPRQGSKFEPLHVQGRVRRIIPESGDLMIDFGYKFDAFISSENIVPKGHAYQIGDMVNIHIYEFEMASNFSGSDKFITLKEADGILVS